MMNGLPPKGRKPLPPSAPPPSAPPPRHKLQPGETRVYHEGIPSPSRQSEPSSSGGLWLLGLLGLAGLFGSEDS